MFQRYEVSGASLAPLYWPDLGLLLLLVVGRRALGDSGSEMEFVLWTDSGERESPRNVLTVIQNV